MKNRWYIIMPESDEVYYTNMSRAETVALVKLRFAGNVKFRLTRTKPYGIYLNELGQAEVAYPVPLY